MLTVRRAQDRGYADHGWLQARHTFSFADYYDPAWRGFRSLRVMNEDIVQPGRGFPTHPHRDMEIVTYLLSGALEHQDSLGSGAVLRPGELQRITAGTGVSHSEFNPSEKDPVHLYQIWLLPERKGLAPEYEQRALDPAGRNNRWQLVASHDGRDGALTIHQDASIYLATLDANRGLTHTLAAGRYAWLQLLRGRVSLNSVELAAGDGAAVGDESTLQIHAADAAEVLLFDLQ